VKKLKLTLPTLVEVLNSGYPELSTFIWGINDFVIESVISLVTLNIVAATADDPMIIE
jgi:hypothetical protein